MAIEISWYYEDHVVLWAQDYEPDDEEAAASNAKINAMMQAAAGDHPVHVIFYLAEEGVGVGLKDPDRIRKHLNFHVNPRCGEIAFYGNSNPLIQMLAKTLPSLEGVSIKIVGSRDEAVTYLKSKDSDLADMA